MNKLIASLLLMCAAGVSVAQTWVDGEVRKVDKPQGKLTLRHGEIKNLDMPAMTMIFRVKDAKMLDGLVEGAKVRFAAEKRDGQITVVELQPAP
ncbi:Copper binding periplasmic protein CusF [Burkholderiales bacterium JOSHI_001]|nr:Copper binding periplasmic protein CusF [Burkholderiales bacterium JOSHI_001]